jgi:hypothetical protein
MKRHLFTSIFTITLLFFPFSNNLLDSVIRLTEDLPNQHIIEPVSDKVDYF